jgi:hypothetical protein
MFLQTHLTVLLLFLLLLLFELSQPLVIFLNPYPNLLLKSPLLLINLLNPLQVFLREFRFYFQLLTYVSGNCAVFESGMAEFYRVLYLLDLIEFI